jgi:hypothetical protein
MIPLGYTKLILNFLVVYVPVKIYRIQKRVEINCKRMYEFVLQHSLCLCRWQHYFYSFIVTYMYL